MGQPYIGEVRAFAFNYQPEGWLPCDGRLLPIAEYQALFSMLGTTYGGDAETDFAIPEIPGLGTARSSQSLTYCIAATGAIPPHQAAGEDMTSSGTRLSKAAGPIRADSS